MRRHCTLLLLSVSLFAQTPRGHYQLSGKVIGADASRLTVAACDPTGPSQFTPTAFVQRDGSFSFTDLPEGPLEIRLLSSSGEIVIRKQVSVGATAYVELELPAHHSDAPPPQPVSVYRLTHKVPGKAMKAWKAAAKAALKGDAEASIASLAQALEADPQFVDALHMRALYAFQAKDLGLARRLMDEAVLLDGASPSLLADAAVVHLASSSLREAERHARAALRLNPGQSRAIQVLNALTH